MSLDAGDIMVSAIGVVVATGVSLSAWMLKQLVQQVGGFESRLDMIHDRVDHVKVHIEQRLDRVDENYAAIRDELISSGVSIRQLVDRLDRQEEHGRQVLTRMDGHADLIQSLGAEIRAQARRAVELGEGQLGLKHQLEAMAKTLQDTQDHLDRHDERLEQMEQRIEEIVGEDAA